MTKSRQNTRSILDTHVFLNRLKQGGQIVDDLGSSRLNGQILLTIRTLRHKEMNRPRALFHVIRKLPSLDGLNRSCLRVPPLHFPSYAADTPNALTQTGLVILFHPFDFKSYCHSEF